MESIGLVCILMLLCPIKGSNFCYYVYQPIPESLAIIGSESIVKLDISVNGNTQEQIHMCNQTTSCCQTSYYFNNVTESYNKICTNRKVQLYATSQGISRYQVPDITQLGKKFFIVCIFDHEHECSVVIGLVQNNAHVTVELTNHTLLYNLTMDGTTINTTNVTTFLSSSKRYVRIYCNCDMSGVSIESNSTISVFSLVHHNVSSATITPMPAVETWDRDYSLISFNDSNINETVFIVTSVKDSFIKVSGHAIIQVPYSGSLVKANFGKKSFMNIKGSHPLLILHVGSMSADPDKPIVTVHPSVNNSMVCLLNDSTQLYFIYQDGMGDVNINCFDNTTDRYEREDTLVLIEGIRYILSEISVNSYGCQIQSTGLTSGYALLSKGNSFQILTIGKSARIETDEDYSIPSSLYNTDPDDSTTDSYGKRFIVFQPSNSTITLFVSCTNETMVTTDTLLENVNDNQTMLCNDTAVAYPIDVSMAFYNQLFEIKSSAEISVYVTGFTENGMFAYLAFPVNVLGYEYIVVSYLNESDTNNVQWSSCHVISVYDDTDIHLIFKPELLSVYYDGNFVSGNDLKVSLQRYQTFTFESSTTDITGARVKSNKPVQLYCGGYSDKSVFYEQIISMNVWGYKYFLKDVSTVYGFDNCFYRIVASDIDTEIIITDTDGTNSTSYVPYGEYLDLLAIEQTVQSNLAILTALICISEQGDVSFSLVASDKQRLLSPPRPSAEHFDQLTRLVRTTFYSEGDFIAAHTSALQLKTIACPYGKAGVGALDTSECFHGTESEKKEGDKTDSCSCSCTNNPHPSNLTLNEKIEQLVKELTVDKTTLSSYKNTKISAPDSRPSARGIGSVAAVILASITIVLLLSDIPIVLVHLKLMKRNCSEGLKRLRSTSR